MAAAVIAIADTCSRPSAPAAATRSALARSCNHGVSGDRASSSVAFGGAIASTRGSHILSSSHASVSHVESLPRLSSFEVVGREGSHDFGLQRSGGRRGGVAVRCVQAGGLDSGTVAEAPRQGQQLPVSSKFVLVVGAAGGVGQLVVASLLDKGAKVRAIIRNAEKAKALFGDKIGEHFELRVRDTRERDALDASVVEGVTHVIIATGTTAYPTKRWFGDNGPKQTDFVGVRNVIDALPRTVQRIVLVSSVGVTKYNRLPYNILNLFGVLKYKKMGEDHLRASGIPFTIIRPAMLVGEPFTAFDSSTLMKTTVGSTNVLIGQGDEMGGVADRSVVAEACVQALDLDFTAGQAYELSSAEGVGPGQELEKWAGLFEMAASAALKSA